jgi:ABC-type sugar transport system substrate-binding protein
MLDASIAFSPYVWGELSVQMGVMMAEGKTLPTEIPIVQVVVTKDNVQQMEDWQ